MSIEKHAASDRTPAECYEKNIFFEKNQYVAKNFTHPQICFFLQLFEILVYNTLKVFSSISTF